MHVECTEQPPFFPSLHSSMSMHICRFKTKASKNVTELFVHHKFVIDLLNTRSGNLRTVPTIVIAHTFCASPDTRISYR